VQPPAGKEDALVSCTKDFSSPYSPRHRPRCTPKLSVHFCCAREHDWRTVATPYPAEEFGLRLWRANFGQLHCNTHNESCKINNATLHLTVLEVLQHKCSVVVRISIWSDANNHLAISSLSKGVCWDVVGQARVTGMEDQTLHKPSIYTFSGAALEARRGYTYGARQLRWTALGSSIAAFGGTANGRPAPE
jgi:hypothetical protein